MGQKKTRRPVRDAGVLTPLSRITGTCGGVTTHSLSSQCPEADTPASVDLVALAELKGLRAVLELLRRDEALFVQQALEGGEPALVIARVLAPRFGLGDMGDQLALEL